MYDDWTLIPGGPGRAGKVVSRRCVLLTELAARIDWERERSYGWRRERR